MNIQEKSITKGPRIQWMDNLRTIIIFLVVLYHAGGVYEASGLWASFWIVDDPAINNLSGLIGLIIDIFVMSTLFFISGYLAPASLKSKNARTFLQSKFRRLMIPWMIAVLTLIPIYKIIFLSSRNLPQEQWTTYFHITNPNSQNWLWFLPVLFTFNVLYVLVAKARIRVPIMSFKWAALGAMVIGFVYSLGMDLYSLRGWTLTPLLDFQNERILIYFFFFLLGIFCFRLQIFSETPKSIVLYIVINAVAWIPITIYTFFLIYPLFSQGNFIVSKAIDKSILWFCFQLSLFSLVYLMIETFRRYFDKSGRIWHELNQNSYYVYIIHVVVMGSIAWFMLDFAIPSVAKYLILTLSTYVVCNLLVYVYRLLSKLTRQHGRKNRRVNKLNTI